MFYPGGSLPSKHHQTTPLITIHMLILFSILLSNTLSGSRIARAANLASLAGWLCNTIEWPVDTNLAPVLAVDSVGKPHVVSVSGAYLDLVYRVFDGNAWQTDIISSVGAQYINLALDSSDIPQITFMRQVGNGKALFLVRP